MCTLIFTKKKNKNKIALCNISNRFPLYFHLSTKRMFHTSLIWNQFFLTETGFFFSFYSIKQLQTLISNPSEFSYQVVLLLHLVNKSSCFMPSWNEFKAKSHSLSKACFSLVLQEIWGLFHFSEEVCFLYPLCVFTVFLLLLVNKTLLKILSWAQSRHWKHVLSLGNT